MCAPLQSERMRNLLNTNLTLIWRVLRLPWKRTSLLRDWIEVKKCTGYITIRWLQTVHFCWRPTEKGCLMDEWAPNLTASTTYWMMSKKTFLVSRKSAPKKTASFWQTRKYNRCHRMYRVWLMNSLNMSINAMIFVTEFGNGYFYSFQNLTENCRLVNM